VRYEVRVPGRGAFEIELDEPPKKGDMLRPFSMLYEVMRVLPAEGDFDGIIEAEWRGGPGEARYVE
jgi:hypothetical protein